MSVCLGDPSGEPGTQGGLTLAQDPIHQGLGPHPHPPSAILIGTVQIRELLMKGSWNRYSSRGASIPQSLSLGKNLQVLVSECHRILELEVTLNAS